MPDIGVDGLLRSPSFHDGYLTGLNLDGDQAKIYLKRVDGSRYTLFLSEVLHLVADNFREGNIICEVEIIVGKPPDPFTLSSLLGELHPSVKEPFVARHLAYAAKISNQIEASELTLVVITPSYGCDLIAACKSITLIADEPT